MKVTSLAAVFCLSWLVGCGPQSSDPGTDSSTQFWKVCSADADCSSGSCLCGRCTKSCSLDDDCAAFPREPVCASPLEVVGCGAEEALSVCAPRSELMISGRDEPEPTDPELSPSEVPKSVDDSEASSSADAGSLDASADAAAPLEAGSADASHTSLSSDTLR